MGTLTGPPFPRLPALKQTPSILPAGHAASLAGEAAAYAGRLRSS
jgi:hypothetical protein